MPPTIKDPKLGAAIELLERTGAGSVDIRWSDEQEPIVWFVVATWFVNDANVPVRRDSEHVVGRRWDTAAGRGPVEALLRLLERVVDGGQCRHCRRPTIFHADLDTNPTPLDPLFCSYEWDPELSVYRRSCEGSTEPIHERTS